MRYFKLVAGGRGDSAYGEYQEISEGEYKFTLEKCMKPAYHEKLLQHMNGFVYMGMAFIALEYVSDETDIDRKAEAEDRDRGR